MSDNTDIITQPETPQPITSTTPVPTYLIDCTQSPPTITLSEVFTKDHHLSGLDITTGDFNDYSDNDEECKLTISKVLTTHDQYGDCRIFIIRKNDKEYLDADEEIFKATIEHPKVILTMSCTHGKFYVGNHVFDFTPEGVEYLGTE